MREGGGLGPTPLLSTGGPKSCSISPYHCHNLWRQAVQQMHWHPGIDLAGINAWHQDIVCPYLFQFQCMTENCECWWPLDFHIKDELQGRRVCLNALEQFFPLRWGVCLQEHSQWMMIPFAHAYLDGDCMDETDCILILFIVWNHNVSLR